MTDDGFTRITLRLPDDLHRLLSEEASARARSMNAEIVYRLQDSFSDASPTELGSMIVELRKQIDRVEETAAMTMIGRSALPAMLAMTRKRNTPDDVQKQLREIAKERNDDPLARIIAMALDGEIDIPQAQLDEILQASVNSVTSQLGDFNRAKLRKEKSRKRAGENDLPEL